jgi:tRNA(Arg) A34 adenosine deaminase TadA
MSDREQINRRDFIVTTAGVAGTAGALGGTALAQAQTPLPRGFDTQDPLIDNWQKQLSAVVDVDLGLKVDARELEQEAVRERHRIYSYLLMKLIHRFWNGNKRGPLGTYPLRVDQKDPVQQTPQRYRGDMIENPEGMRINWDRYLGHNIACIAVDGNGEIIDFDFNHNDFFRSSAEHAESRIVRRLFSLTDIFDSWRTGQRIRDKPRAASLNEVTLYTSLESCAQCSGVMSLAGIKQIIYLQNDFTAYMIGNIMYKLANRIPIRDAQGTVVGTRPGAPVPIPGSAVGLDEFKVLNDANLEFVKNIKAAEAAKNPNGAFFVSADGKPDFEPSITSFLCTDAAYKIFEAGGKKLDQLALSSPDFRFPDSGGLQNQQCLKEAQEFYKYADIEGYRGSPHKL